MHVYDLMRKDEGVPRVGPDAAFTDVMREMSAKVGIPLSTLAKVEAGRMG